ncbi:MAG: NAD(P)-dependent oxidoreductase [Candidatus Nanopelagicus sp.]
MKVFITARIDPEQVNRLTSNGFEVEQGGFGLTGVKLDQAQLIEKFKEIDVAIIEFENITEGILNSGKRLKIMACLRNEPAASTDIEAASKLNIPVLFTPGRNAVAVAEYTIGLMLSIARSIATTHHLLRYTDELTSVSYSDKAGDRKSVTSEWSMDPDAPFQRFQGEELMGKTMGLVGAGFIGQEIAKRAAALGMNLIAFDPYANADQLARLNIGLVDLNKLAQESDFVVMAAKVTPESTGVFSAKAFAQMKKSAYFINTARAALVDYDALYKALVENKIAGAALDVYPTEPLPSDSPLRKLSNVVLSPHLAGATTGVVKHHSKMVVDDLLLIKVGKIPSRVANPKVMDAFIKKGGLN